LDELEGRVCYGGLDLASTTDITAFVLVFPPYGDDDKYTVALIYGAIYSVLAIVANGVGSLFRPKSHSTNSPRSS
jgi:hypothetical protein